VTDLRRPDTTLKSSPSTATRTASRKHSSAPGYAPKCASIPEAAAAIVRRRAPRAARIALDAGSMFARHDRNLRALGLPVVCLDAHHATAAHAMQLNKTDANDALGLAKLVRTSTLHSVSDRLLVGGSQLRKLFALQ
jgi:transposase